MALEVEYEDLESMELEASGLVQKMLNCIDDTKKFALMVVINRTDFLLMAFHLVEIKPLLEQFTKESEFLKSHLTWPPLQHLRDVLNALYTFTQNCTIRSRIYLLYRSNELANEINKHFIELIHCLGTMLRSLFDIPIGLKDLILVVQERLQSAKFYQEPASAELARDIFSGLSKGQCDEIQATSLLQKIADHLKVPELEAAELKRELQNDMERSDLEGREDAQELQALHRLFSLAHILHEKRRLASVDLLLHHAGIASIPSSFFCPITGSLMHEPVMIAEEGYTYEKSAVLEWFERGHRTCPDTGNKLQSLELIPNVKLQQAMVEFFDHMYQAQMVFMLQVLTNRMMGLSIDKALHTVKELTDLCDKYTRLMISLDGVETVVALLKPSAPKLQEIIVKVLSNIAVLGDEHKISIVAAGAVPELLGLLQRNPVENGSLTRLLCELSKIQAGRRAIVSEKGSILIIATAFNLSQSNDKPEIEKLLDILCQNDTSVIVEAAISTFFQPLVSSLIHGDERTKLDILTALVSSSELNKHRSVAFVQAGIVPPLLNLLQHGSPQSIQATTKALLQLSCTEQNKMNIAKAGAIPVLVKFLSSPSAQVKVDITATLSNLATDSRNAQEIDSEGAVGRLSMMLRLPDTVLQDYSLKTLQCMTKDSQTVRNRMMELRIVPTLYDILQSGDLSLTGQKSVLNILCHIAEDHETSQAVVTSGEGVNFLIRLLETNVTVEEKEAVFEILAALLHTEQLQPQMLSDKKLLKASAEYLGHISPKTQERAAVLISKLADQRLVGTRVQMELAKQGVITSLIGIISAQFSTERAKQYAAETLYLFSMHTPSLTDRQSIAKKLLASLGVKKFKACEVHTGKCSIKETFCLVEGGAVPCLVNLIKEGGLHSAERAVEALYTLVSNDENIQRGVDYLVKNKILPALVTLVGRNLTFPEKAVSLLGKIFGVEKYRDDKYSSIVKPILLTMVATGSSDERTAAAAVLMHFGMIQENPTHLTTGSS